MKAGPCGRSDPPAANPCSMCTVVPTGRLVGLPGLSGDELASSATRQRRYIVAEGSARLPVPGHTKEGIR